MFTDKNPWNIRCTDNNSSRKFYIRFCWTDSSRGSINSRNLFINSTRELTHTHTHTHTLSLSLSLVVIRWKLLVEKLQIFLAFLKIETIKRDNFDTISSHRNDKEETR